MTKEKLARSSGILSPVHIDIHSWSLFPPGWGDSTSHVWIWSRSSETCTLFSPSLSQPPFACLPSDSYNNGSSSDRICPSRTGHLLNAESTGCACVYRDQDHTSGPSWSLAGKQAGQHAFFLLLSPLLTILHIQHLKLPYEFLNTTRCVPHPSSRLPGRIWCVCFLAGWRPRRCCSSLFLNQFFISLFLPSLPFNPSLIPPTWHD